DLRVGPDELVVDERQDAYRVISADHGDDALDLGLKKRPVEVICPRLRVVIEPVVVCPGMWCLHDPQVERLGQLPLALFEPMRQGPGGTAGERYGADRVPCP